MGKKTIKHNRKLDIVQLSKSEPEISIDPDYNLFFEDAMNKVRNTKFDHMTEQQKAIIDQSIENYDSSKILAIINAMKISKAKTGSVFINSETNKLQLAQIRDIEIYVYNQINLKIINIKSNRTPIENDFKEKSVNKLYEIYENVNDRIINIDKSYSNSNLWPSLMHTGDVKKVCIRFSSDADAPMNFDYNIIKEILSKEPHNIYVQQLAFLSLLRKDEDSYNSDLIKYGNNVLRFCPSITNDPLSNAKLGYAYLFSSNTIHTMNFSNSKIPYEILEEWTFNVYKEDNIIYCISKRDYDKPIAILESYISTKSYIELDNYLCNTRKENPGDECLREIKSFLNKKEYVYNNIDRAIYFLEIADSLPINCTVELNKFIKTNLFISYLKKSEIDCKKINEYYAENNLFFNKNEEYYLAIIGYKSTHGISLEDLEHDIEEACNVFPESSKLNAIAMMIYNQSSKLHLAEKHYNKVQLLSKNKNFGGYLDILMEYSKGHYKKVLSIMPKDSIEDEDLKIIRLGSEVHIAVEEDNLESKQSLLKELLEFERDSSRHFTKYNIARLYIILGEFELAESKLSVLRGPLAADLNRQMSEKILMMRGEESQPFMDVDEIFAYLNKSRMNKYRNVTYADIIEQLENCNIDNAITILDNLITEFPDNKHYKLLLSTISHNYKLYDEDDDYDKEKRYTDKVSIMYNDDYTQCTIIVKNQQYNKIYNKENDQESLENAIKDNNIFFRKSDNSYEIRISDTIRSYGQYKNITDNHGNNEPSVFLVDSHGWQRYICNDSNRELTFSDKINSKNNSKTYTKVVLKDSKPVNIKDSILYIYRNKGKIYCVQKDKNPLEILVDNPNTLNLKDPKISTFIGCSGYTDKENNYVNIELQRREMQINNNSLSRAL